MSLTPAELRSRLQSAIEHAKTDATDVARTIKRSPEYVRDFLNGRKNSLKLNDLLAIENILQTPPGYLTGSGGDSSGYVTQLNAGVTKRSSRSPSPYSIEEHDLLIASGDNPQGEGALPIYPSNESISGQLKVLTTAFEFVQRPWFLREVRESFAIIIAGEAMAPAFEPGDIAIVNPRLPLVRNRNVLLTKLGETGTFDALVTRLVRWTSTAWTVKPFNSQEELHLGKDKWPYALRVAGRVEMT